MNAKAIKEPVLLSVDNIEFEKHLNLIRNRLIPGLEKIKTEFLKFGLGQMTNEYLDDILFDKLKVIRERLAEKIREETPSRFLKGEATNAANKMLAKIYAEIAELSGPGNYELPILMNYAAVDDSGNIVLTDEAIAELKEFHSSYVCTERGIELLELHRKAASAINDFYQKARANLSDNIVELGELFEFDFEGNISPAFRYYDNFDYAKNGPEKKN